MKTGRPAGWAAAPAAALLLSMFAAAACSFTPADVRLTPDEEEFLSKARYIISGRERRDFLRTPPDRRLQFIEEFWNKRDPDPTTEENEFRAEYFNRIEEAERLFSGEGRPGWLTDRGRVFVILGPPDSREAYAGGYRDDTLQIRRDTIIWYYRGIPLIFIDTRGNGEFELSLSDLSRLESLQTLLAGLPERATATAVESSGFLDFAHALRKNPDGFRVLALEVPYRRIWFNVRGENMETTLSLRLTIVDKTGRTVVRDAHDIPLAMTEKQLLRLKGKSHALEVPLLLEGGTYEVRLSIQNKVSGEEKHKTFALVVPK